MFMYVVEFNKYILKCKMMMMMIMIMLMLMMMNKMEERKCFI